MGIRYAPFVKGPPSSQQQEQVNGPGSQGDGQAQGCRAVDPQRGAETLLCNVIALVSIRGSLLTLSSMLNGMRIR